MLKNYHQKLQEIHTLVLDTAKKTLLAHEIAYESFVNRNSEGFEKVAELIKSLDEEARTIDNEVVKAIALFGPEASQLRELITNIKLTNELVRIGDYAKTYAKSMRKHLKNEVDFTKIDKYILQLHEAAIEALHKAFAILEENDSNKIDALYHETLVEESKTDEIFTLFEKELLANLCEDTDKLEDFLNILGTCRKLERTGDRAVEVAKLQLFAKKGGKLESF